MITLVAREVMYFSAGDEHCFFAWLDRIAAVKSVRGRGRDVAIELDENACTDADLRELLALFHRYGVELQQLRQLITNANAHWFRDNQRTYWHDAVFGASRGQS